jgi:glycine cleavage system transcriptional repressor
VDRGRDHEQHAEGLKRGRPDQLRGVAIEEAEQRGAVPGRRVAVDRLVPDPAARERKRGADRGDARETPPALLLGDLFRREDRNILESMRHFALSAIGRDQPGIVAAISAVLLEHEGNVEDSQMTILRGHFTMTLLVSVPDQEDSERLADALRQAGERLGLEAMAFSEVAELAKEAEPAPSHVVSVYGIDHPGILHAVSSTLAHHGASITDLTTRLLAGEGDTAVYALMLELALPPGLEPAALERALEQVGERENVEVSFHELERDEL